MFCNYKMWFFIIIYKVSRFYLDFIFFKMSSRIFLVAAIDYIIWRFVIYFFKVFLLVESFNVCITRDKSFIWIWISLFYYQPYDFFIKTIYPCFLRIYKMFNAFCYSIYIIALRNWILSLKFSNICSLINFIYYF
jgi:hypothetical protein